jgi:ketosteroid isomerase-like protein
MPTTGTATSDEAQIRERLNAWTRALRAKDLDALMALYAQDVVTFDLMPPHQVPDAAHYRKNFQRWFAAMPGSIDYEIHDLRITQGTEVAFCHCLGHVRGARANGERADYWVRVTVGFQKRNGDWLMTHDHVSMPLEMETRKAVSELRR